MTTIRLRLNLPLLLLLIVAPLLIGGVCMHMQQFIRIAKLAPMRLDTGSSLSFEGRPDAARRSSQVIGTGSDFSVERSSDEVISRFMNQETSGAPHAGVLCFFFCVHGLMIGCLTGAAKSKLI